MASSYTVPEKEEWENGSNEGTVEKEEKSGNELQSIDDLPKFLQRGIFTTPRQYKKKRYRWQPLGLLKRAKVMALPGPLLQSSNMSDLRYPVTGRNSNHNCVVPQVLRGKAQNSQKTNSNELGAGLEIERLRSMAELMKCS